MIDVRKYNLPDYSIYESEVNDFKFWIPDKKYLILGAGNNPEDSLIIENVILDKIPVYKRPSGGQTVLISPETLVISVVFVNSDLQPKKVFNKINSIIIKTLNEKGIENLLLKGISDIAIGEKKILGSSIYRKKEKYFYHAVLNISESPDIFERYLKHPTKEPEYRQGRSHKDFVTSIHLGGYHISKSELISLMNKAFISGLN